jgi:catechol 2,3-dioxygenase-like lactoylglutathione lyase family enzyme
LVVQDMERCLAFYCGVLGLTIRAEAAETGPFIDYLLQLRGVRVHTAKLAAAEGPTLLELLEFHEPNADRRREISVKTLGLTHVALTVVDLDALAPLLVEAGATFVGQPRISADGKVKAAYFRDIEGNFLELVEEL